MEMRVPIWITKDDVRCAVRTSIIGVMKKSSHIRLDSQYVKIVRARFDSPDQRWTCPRVQRNLADAESCQTIEAVVAIAHIEIVGIGLDRELIAGILEHIKALSLRHIQRTQDQTIQNAE